MAISYKETSISLHTKHCNLYSFLKTLTSLNILMFFSPSIQVYGSMDTAAHCLLTLRNPEGCPVLCLKHSGYYLFAGLRDGMLMVYERHHRGTSYITSDVSLYCSGADVCLLHPTLKCIWETPTSEQGNSCYGLSCISVGNKIHSQTKANKQ